MEFDCLTSYHHNTFKKYKNSMVFKPELKESMNVRTVLSRIKMITGSKDIHYQSVGNEKS